MLKSQVIQRIYNTIEVKNGFRKLTAKSYMLNNPVLILGKDKYPRHYLSREEGIRAGKAHINTTLNEGHMTVETLCRLYNLNEKHLIGNFPRSLQLTSHTYLWDIID